MSKEVQGTELVAGSWNQTLIGDVLTFPVRDVSANLENKTPLTLEKVALTDFDVTFSYSINPSAVSELWTKQPRSFHATDAKDGDVFLMYNYMIQTVNAASYKVVATRKALELVSQREKLESDLAKEVKDRLEAAGFGTTLTLSVLQVRSIVPPESILASSEAVVRSTNELRVKENEVQIARKEAERMAALSANSGQSISYMDAQARLNVSEAIKLGKVQTIVIPFDFKGQVVVNKP
jgi:regulator of protease activity HflC (stomatin/prohibitin superfamily)